MNNHTIAPLDRPVGLSPRHPPFLQEAITAVWIEQLLAREES